MNETIERTKAATPAEAEVLAGNLAVRIDYVPANVRPWIVVVRRFRPDGVVVGGPPFRFETRAAAVREAAVHLAREDSRAQAAGRAYSDVLAAVRAQYAELVESVAPEAEPDRG